MLFFILKALPSRIYLGSIALNDTCDKELILFAYGPHFYFDKCLVAPCHLASRVVEIAHF